MGFKILDASAFYAGVAFRSTEQYYTTQLVYDEIKHIKKKYDILEILVETGKIRIIEPDKEFTKKAEFAAKKTGDLEQLSKQDISVIALALHMNGEIVTDDYSIANVVKNLKMQTWPVMTRGIRDVGRWHFYCPVCKKNQRGKKCNNCGTPLKRKLIK